MPQDGAVRREEFVSVGARGEHRCRLKARAEELSEAGSDPAVDTLSEVASASPGLVALGIR